jgi:hypothetical protein
MDLFHFLLAAVAKEHPLRSRQMVELVKSLLHPNNEAKLLHMLGLATVSQRESNTMKLLAFDSEALPVDAGDEIHFEDVVLLHFERLYLLRLKDNVMRSALCMASKSVQGYI